MCEHKTHSCIFHSKLLDPLDVHILDAEKDKDKILNIVYNKANGKITRINPQRYYNLFCIVFTICLWKVCKKLKLSKTFQRGALQNVLV